MLKNIAQWPRTPPTLEKPLSLDPSTNICNLQLSISLNSRHLLASAGTCSQVNKQTHTNILTHNK